MPPPSGNNDFLKISDSTLDLKKHSQSPFHSSQIRCPRIPGSLRSSFGAHVASVILDISELRPPRGAKVRSGAAKRAPKPPEVTSRAAIGPIFHQKLELKMPLQEAYWPLLLQVLPSTAAAAAQNSKRMGTTCEYAWPSCRRALRPTQPGPATQARRNARSD